MCIFETERLTVRKLVRANLSDFQRLQGSAGVMRYITGIPHTHTPQESARDLAEIIARYDIEDNNTWIWAVFTKSGDFIGTCALFENEAQEFEIAYRLLETCWGQGYGQETANGLIDYCLDELRLNSIVAQTVTDNLASVKILDRSWLTFVAEVENKEKHWMERHYRYAQNLLIRENNMSTNSIELYEAIRPPTGGKSTALKSVIRQLKVKTLPMIYPHEIALGTQDRFDNANQYLNFRKWDRAPFYYCGPVCIDIEYYRKQLDDLDTDKDTIMTILQKYQTVLDAARQYRRLSKWGIWHMPRKMRDHPKSESDENLKRIKAFKDIVRSGGAVYPVAYFRNKDIRDGLWDPEDVRRYLNHCFELANGLPMYVFLNGLFRHKDREKREWVPENEFCEHAKVVINSKWTDSASGTKHRIAGIVFWKGYRNDVPVKIPEIEKKIARRLEILRHLLDTNSCAEHL